MKSNFYKKIKVDLTDFAINLKDDEGNLKVFPVADSGMLEKHLIQLEASDIEDKQMIVNDTYSVLTANILAKKIKSIYVPVQLWSLIIGTRATASEVLTTGVKESIDVDLLKLTKNAINSLLSAIEENRTTDIQKLQEFVTPKISELNSLLNEAIASPVGKVVYRNDSISQSAELGFALPDEAVSTVIGKILRSPDREFIARKGEINRVRAFSKYTPSVFSIEEIKGDWDKNQEPDKKLGFGTSVAQVVEFANRFLVLYRKV